MQNENQKTQKNVTGEVTKAPSEAHKTTHKGKAQNDGAKSNPKRKYYKPKYPKNKGEKGQTTKAPMVSPKKIKLIFTVINREKTEFFVDFLQQFEINVQLVLSARGTANDHIMSLLGLTDSDKSVIIGIIRQDRIKDAMAALEEKFNTVKGGKGIAYTVPIKSTIGVAIYRFLSNTAGGGLMNG